MKKLFIIAALMVVAFSSCTRYDLDDIPADEPSVPIPNAKKFTFTVKGDFMNPEFRDGASRANNDYMVADGVEMTDLWVVDVVGGEIKQELHQTNADADWGMPTMNLAIGTHHIYFLASRGTAPVYQDGRVKWAKPLDTFYLDYNVVVVKTSNGNRSVTLDRVASKMTLYVEDDIPTGTTSMIFSPSVWYNGFDMLSGSPILAEDYSVNFSIPQTWWERSGANFSVWSLSSVDEWQTDVKVSSMSGSKVDAAVVIKDVPLKANRTTIYRGNLYSDNVANGVNLNANWLSSYEGVY